MKQLRTVLAALLLLCSTVATAHDFEVDGIYYNILSQNDNTAGVTYKGSGSYNAEYRGDVTIPANVTYNGTTYSVTTIGERAFYYCTSLTSIEIPNSVTIIGDNAFNGCSSLTSMTVEENNPVYDSRNNCNAIIETASNTLISGCKNTVIPNSVTTIGNYAFDYCRSLTSITIPNSVTTIGNYAFNACNSLTSIVIPNSVTTIGSSAFSSCSGLTSISVAAGNTTYDSRDNCNAIIETTTNTLIAGCKNTIIPNSVTTIGDHAFHYCSSLTSIEIPGSVTTIGDYAFYDCISLTSIEIPNSVTYIGGSAFYNCRSLTSIEIPNSVTTIGKSAFGYCSSLTSITIPGSVTTIGYAAFCGCSSLTSVKIPNSVTTIGESAFKYCEGLTSIEIPNSVTTIGNTAFYECHRLANIEIPNSVTTIGELAFYFCSSITSVVIPNSVTTIGASAFSCCGSLTSVVIPNSVTTIGDNAFYYGISLTSITSFIPAEKLFELGYYVFSGIDKENCTLYVPAGAKETYATTEGWNEFTNIVELSVFDLTVSAAKYATLYLDYNATIPAGVEVYTASTVDGNYLMMQEVTGTLPANTGVIVRAEQGTYTFAQSDEEVAAIDNNLFRGSAEDVYITPAKEAKYYVLSMKDGVVGMYEDALTGGTFKNNAHKAYLVLGEKNLGIYDEEVDTEDPGMQLSNKYYFDFGGTTAIDPVVTEVNDNIYYDLSGRRVENPTRGIYIVNGKKRLIK